MLLKWLEKYQNKSKWVAEFENQNIKNAEFLEDKKQVKEKSIKEWTS